MGNRMRPVKSDSVDAARAQNTATAVHRRWTSAVARGRIPRQRRHARRSCSPSAAAQPSLLGATRARALDASHEPARPRRRFSRQSQATGARGWPHGARLALPDPRRHRPRLGRRRHDRPRDPPSPRAARHRHTPGAPHLGARAGPHPPARSPGPAVPAAAHPRADDERASLDRPAGRLHARPRPKPARAVLDCHLRQRDARLPPGPRSWSCCSPTSASRGTSPAEAGEVGTGRCRERAGPLPPSLRLFGLSHLRWARRRTATACRVRA